MMQPDNNNNNDNKKKEKEKRPPKPIKKKDFVISAPSNFRSFDEQPQLPPISNKSTIPPPLPNKSECKLLNNNYNTNNNNYEEEEEEEQINNEITINSNQQQKYNEKIYFKVSNELLEDVKKWEIKKIEYSKSIDSLLLKKQEQLTQIFNDYLLEMRPILDNHFTGNLVSEQLKQEILENEQKRLKQVQQQLFGSKNASIVTIESQIKSKRHEIDMHNKITLIQSIVRGWLAKKRYRTMRLKLQKRQLCLNEIVETERKYVESLSLLIRLFLVPLQTTKKELLSVNEIQSIFANSSVIYGVHKELLESLENSVNNKSGKSIAECFLSLSPFLKLYTQYINNFNNASTTLNECKKKDSKIKDFFFKENKDNPQLGKRDFLDLQIQPVQRIPRYRLLLTELLHCTPIDHIEYEAVKKALSEIQELAMNINESKRTAEGLEKIILIQSSLTKNIEIVKPHRKLIKDSPIFFERRGKLKERYLFLFNDSILLCKRIYGILSSSNNTNTATTTIINSNNNNNSNNAMTDLIGNNSGSSLGNSEIRYLPITFMDMNNVIILPTQDPEYQYGFAVLGNEHLYFYSKNAVEQHEWLLILKEITKELDQNQNTLKRDNNDTEFNQRDSLLNPIVKQQDSRDSLHLASSISNPKRQSKLLDSQQSLQNNQPPKVVERYSGSLGNSGGSSSGNNSPNQSIGISPPTFSSSPPPFNPPVMQPVIQPVMQPTIRELINIYSEINELQKELINPSNQFELLINGQLGQIQMIRQQYPNLENVFNKLTQLLYRLSNCKNQTTILLSNETIIQSLQNVIVQGKDHIGAYNEWIKRTFPMGPSDPNSTQPRFLTINFMKWYNNLHTVWGQILDIKPQ